MSKETEIQIESQLFETDLRQIPKLRLSTGHPIDFSKDHRRIPQAKPIIGTFGFMNNQKDVYQTAHLLADVCLALDGIGLVCGQIALTDKRTFKAIWIKKGLNAKSLRFESSLSDEEFDDEMSKATLAIQLRNYSNGETSGVIPLLAAKGIPTIVTDLGSFSELPDDLFFKLSPKKDFGLSINYSEILSGVLGVLRSGPKLQNLQLGLASWASQKSFRKAAQEILAFMRSVN